MDNIYQGAHTYCVYYLDCYGSAFHNSCTICADSESEAIRKFKTQVYAGRRGGTSVVRVVKIRKENDPTRFEKAAEEIYKAAKEATIELLKAQGEKCFVINSKFFSDDCDYDDYSVYGSDGYFYRFQCVGLDKSGQLIIGGTQVSPGGGYSYEEFAPGFDDTRELYSFSYLEIYLFVASHLPEDAVTREDAERMLNEH